MNTTSRSEQLQVAGKPCNIDQTLLSFHLPKLRSSKNLERSCSLQVCTKRLGRGAAGTNQHKTVSWGNTDVQQHNGSEVVDCFLSRLSLCALPRTRARKLLAANTTFYCCFGQPPSSPATNPIKTRPRTQLTNLSAVPWSCNPGQTTAEGSGSPWQEVQGAQLCWPLLSQEPNHDPALLSPSPRPLHPFPWQRTSRLLRGEELGNVCSGTSICCAPEGTAKHKRFYQPSLPRSRPRFRCLFHICLASPFPVRLSFCTYWHGVLFFFSLLVSNLSAVSFTWWNPHHHPSRKAQKRRAEQFLLHLSQS